MAELPAIAWAAIAGVGLATCIGALAALAATVRHEVGAVGVGVPHGRVRHA